MIVWNNVIIHNRAIDFSQQFEFPGKIVDGSTQPISMELKKVNILFCQVYSVDAGDSFEMCS